MSKNKFETFAKKINSKFEFNYSIKNLNWFNIGGNTKVFFKPDNLDDLISFLKMFGQTEKYLY